MVSYDVPPHDPYRLGSLQHTMPTYHTTMLPTVYPLPGILPRPLRRPSRHGLPDDRRTGLVRTTHDHRVSLCAASWIHHDRSGRAESLRCTYAATVWIKHARTGDPCSIR